MADAISNSNSQQNPAAEPAYNPNRAGKIAEQQFLFTSKPQQRLQCNSDFLQKSTLSSDLKLEMEKSIFELVMAMSL